MTENSLTQCSVGVVGWVIHWTSGELHPVCERDETDLFLTLATKFVVDLSCKDTLVLTPLLPT